MILAVSVIIILAFYVPVQKSKYVHIGISVGTSQGAAENNSGMESIKVNGTFWNYGEITANSLTATVIFTDTAHNEVVRKTVKEEMDLPPNKGQIVDFYSEYSRERTIPKTEVDIMIQFDWMENGQLKTTLMPIKIASNY